MTSTASASNSHSCETFTFTLPPLPYEYTALEPIVDTQTMEIHHQQHHNTYVNNLNKIIKGQPEVSDIFAVFDLIRSGKGGDAMRNNGGGHYNHALFWKWMTPSDSLRNVGPSSELLGKIVEKWTSFEEMQNKFNDAALTRFGSGWAWLGVKPDGELEITSTPNQGMFRITWQLFDSFFEPYFIILNAI